MDLSDVASYKLSMDKVDKFFNAQRNMVIKMKSLTAAQQEALSLSGSPRPRASSTARTTPPVAVSRNRTNNVGSMCAQSS